MAEPVSIPFSTPGAAQSRAEIDALSRALASMENAQHGAAVKTDSAGAALSREAQAAAAAARQTTQAGREIAGAAGDVAGAVQRSSVAAENGFRRMVDGIRGLRSEMKDLHRVIGFVMIGQQVADIGEKLLSYGQRLSDFTSKVADLRKKSQDAREEAIFKASGTEYGLAFQLRAGGLEGKDAEGLAKRATGLVGAFKPGEQFSFLESLVSGARRQGRSAEEIQALATAGMGAFQQAGAVPGFADSYQALALARGRKAPRDETEAQELGRQAMGLAVRRGGLSAEAEQSLIEGIKSGLIAVSRSGRLSGDAAVVGDVNRRGGLALEEAHGQGFFSLVDRDRGTVRMERGGRVGEATPDELPGFLPSGEYSAGLRNRTKAAGSPPIVISAAEAEKQAGGKPNMLETREWIELGTVAAMVALNFKALAGTVAAAGAMIGRVFGVGAGAAAAAGAGTAAVGATGAGATGAAGAVALRTVATRVAVPVAALSMAGMRGGQIGSTPEEDAFLRSPEAQAARGKGKGPSLQHWFGEPASPEVWKQAREDYDKRMLQALEGIERNTAKAAEAPTPAPSAH